MQIRDVKVRVCFNGRGDPGIEADVLVEERLGRALSPSGASRGTNEAVPFVDDDPAKTASQFNEKMASRIKGLDAADSAGITRALREIDGTKNYSRIGGSLAYAVSVAAARGGGQRPRRPDVPRDRRTVRRPPVPARQHHRGREARKRPLPGVPGDTRRTPGSARRERGDRAQPQGPQGGGDAAVEDARLSRGQGRRGGMVPRSE